MGMFDWVNCEVPLPDGWVGHGMQTKDLDCSMGVVTITADGRLFGDARAGWWQEKQPDRDLQYHGDLTFYGYGKDVHSDWHEYTARFTDGQLVSIQLVQSGQE